MFSIRSSAGVVFVAIVLAILGASQVRAEKGKEKSCPCLFEVSFWTQPALLDALNPKARVAGTCSEVKLDRSTRKTLRMAGPKPLNLRMTLELAHDTGSDNFKAESFCKAKWKVEGSRGQGSIINFDQKILLDVVYYEVIADPMSPYKELMSTIPSVNANPFSFEACEAALRKIAQSYEVNCESK